MPAGVYPELSRRAGMTNLHSPEGERFQPSPRDTLTARPASFASNKRSILLCHGGWNQFGGKRKALFVADLKDSQPFASQNDQVSSNKCSDKKLYLAMSPAKKSSSDSPTNTTFMMTVNID